MTFPFFFFNSVFFFSNFFKKKKKVTYQSTNLKRKMLLIPVLFTVYFFTVERSCVVAVPLRQLCPGPALLFPALGSRASLENRTSFCSWFLFFLSFFF